MANHSRYPILICSLVGILSVGCDVHIGPRKVAPDITADHDAATMVRNSLNLRAGAAASTADPTALGEPTGWGTVKGVFKVTGAAPKRATLLVNKDTEVCAPGGKTVLDETVVVGPDGGLANVLIYLSTPIPKDDPKWEHESYQQAKTAEVLFDQKACIFLSHTFAMRTTQRMKVKNSDPVGHNTNLDSKRGSKPANFSVGANADAIYEPGAASPAPFPVSCSIHPWMKAWVMVSDNPYFAVTNEKGEFEIANIPAGIPLEFRVWQEKTTLQQVTVNGEAAKWPKGKLSLKLADAEVKNLEVSIDAGILE